MQGGSVFGRMLWLVLAAVAVPAVHAATSTVRPESAGLSAARVARVTELMQRQIDARSCSPAP